MRNHVANNKGSSSCLFRWIGRIALATIVSTGLGLGVAMAKPDHYVGPNCAAEPVAGLLDAPPFDRPTIRSLWRARQELLAWEARPDVRELLDELARQRMAAQAYFGTLDMVLIYQRNPALSGQSRDGRAHILGNVEKFKQLRGAPQAWVDVVVKLIVSGADVHLSRFINASIAAADDMREAKLELPGRRPVVDELVSLSDRAHAIWTVACSTPIRVFNSSTSAPLPPGLLMNPAARPEKAFFEDAATVEIVKMQHDQADSLADHLAVLQGQAPVRPRLGWAELSQFINRTILAEEPKLLAQIERMTEVQLKELREKLRQGVVSGQPVLRALDRPSVNRAMTNRRITLAGLAPEPSTLPFKERAHRNLPPTEDELRALLTGISMDYTRSLNPGMEFSRSGEFIYDDYMTSTLFGRHQTGSTQVNIVAPTCKPLPKGHRCTFVMNLYRTQMIIGGLENAKAMPADEYAGVVYWGVSGLESKDLDRTALGWQRVVTRSGSGGRGESSDGHSDRALETMHQGLSERSEAAAERQRRAQEQWEADQQDRRLRNRSCGPAPNICN